jgi:hypothetical protein
MIEPKRKRNPFSVSASPSSERPRSPVPVVDCTRDEEVSTALDAALSVSVSQETIREFPPWEFWGNSTEQKHGRGVVDISQIDINSWSK